MAPDATTTLEPDPPPPSPQPMRRLPKTARRLLWWGVGGVLVLAFGWVTWLDRSSGQDVKPAPKEFCVAAKKFEKELSSVEVTLKKDLARQIELGDAMLAVAPADVRADTELFLAQMRAMQAAPNAKAKRELQDDPEVEAAVERVQRRYAQGCGVYARSGL